MTPKMRKNEALLSASAPVWGHIYTNIYTNIPFTTTGTCETYHLMCHTLNQNSRYILHILPNSQEVSEQLAGVSST